MTGKRSLSRLDRRIVAGVLAGRSAAEVAAEIGISHEALRTHLTALLTRLADRACR